MGTHHRRLGFTLLELALVISIIGIVTGMGIYGSLSLMESSRQTSTQNKLDTIEKALLTFQRSYGRLPCPSDITLADSSASYGAEAGSAGACASANYISSVTTAKAVEGGVPIKALGLPNEFALDGWGRKMAYAVTPSFTATDALHNIPTQTTCSVAIHMLDSAGGNRSTNVAYTLVSYGPNGHGAFVPGGGSTRFNADASNTQEQGNCHCTSAAANSTYDGNYTLRDAELDTTTASDYFDDIVRYKERSQFVSQEDRMNDKGYRGPTLAVGFDDGGTGALQLYKKDCGDNWIKQTDLSPLPLAPKKVVFTDKNTHLISYDAGGCHFYKITGNTLSNLVAPVCAYDATDGSMAFSNNGYLAASDGGGTITISKQAGDSFQALTSLSSATTTSLSFSRNADYLVLSDGTIYRRTGNSFGLLGTSAALSKPPTPLSSPTSYTFSPDGRYLGSTNATDVKIWRMPSISKPAAADIAELTTISSVGTGVRGIAFSPDGQYFAYDRTDTPRLGIYKINANDTFTSVTITNTGGYISAGGAGKRFAFSADSNYLVVVGDTITTLTGEGVVILKRTGATAFEPIVTTTNPLGEGTFLDGSAAAFAH